MVHWLCIPIMLMIGAVAGFFIFAFMEISREKKEEKRKWWDDG